MCIRDRKTAVIDALYYLHRIMIGHPLEDKIVDYIDAKSDCGEISANFNIFTEDVIYEVSYTIVLQKSEKYAMIVRETLSCAINQGNSRSNKTVFMDYKRIDRADIFSPKKRDVYKRQVIVQDRHGLSIVVIKLLSHFGR